MNEGVRIDRDRCTRCGVCTQVCAACFEEGPDSFPRPLTSPEDCLVCGHCGAVCPEGAILNEKTESLRTPDLRIPFKYEDLLDLLCGRRSCRAFSGQGVSEEDVRRLLAAAAQSPNSFNRGNVRYTVITDRKILQAMAELIAKQTVRLTRLLSHPAGRALFRLFLSKAYRELEPLLPLLAKMEDPLAAGKDLILYGAPCMILVHTPESDGDTGCEDAVYAAANILSAAQTMMLGTCVIGFVTGPMRSSNALRALARIPEGRRVRTTIIVGHPAHSFARAILRKDPPTDWITG
ncbi:MAG: nitroreductase family protein [Elusimicrobiota bacterium]|jgi:nitroreductase/NAD-dependent dihydropyrimidine dehydrogenase PreA subunit